MHGMKQHTIRKPARVSGIGLHTGKPVNLNFLPAPVGHGIKFQRVDLDDRTVVPADVAYVANTNRSTTLKAKEAQISTVEHVLAALMGLHIDNVLIELDGPETPIMDGSAMPFAQALLDAGLEEQDADREFLEILEPISVRDEATGSEIVALPSDRFQATAMIDFRSPVLGMQYAALDDIDAFVQEIAPCRTFVFLHELEQLLEHGLIKGGDLDNAIVIVDRVMDQAALDRLAAKLNKPSVKVEKEGILNTLSLHFSNEPARHKLLDLVGDLALVGCPIKGKIVATKPGHTINVQLAAKLKEALKQQRKLANVPRYDPTQPPLFDVMAIARNLPHRFPFLLVDKIIELNNQYVVGVKNVTFNEEFFQGHFPGNPVMPGVLQIEAMAQTGGILVLSSLSDPENWDTYFLKIDNARFKNKVVPGDTLILKLELLSPIRRGLCHMQGTAYVGNKIVSEAELLAQIIRREPDKK
jgi:UDP-3-O-[3-hydroxymyristoyl] N-acetylglucosamine deacetylase/3-hydroxyacyl-[acyl-carrier-protein] dehydratase